MLWPPVYFSHSGLLGIFWPTKRLLLLLTPEVLFLPVCTKLPHSLKSPHHPTAKSNHLPPSHSLPSSPASLLFLAHRDCNLGFPSWLCGKESACWAGGMGSIPESGWSPGEGNGSPLQCFYLENPADRGALHGEHERVEHHLVTKHQI